jgi:hypothetical protein
MADPKISSSYITYSHLLEVLIGQNFPHVNEILDIVITSREKLRHKHVVYNSRL